MGRRISNADFEANHALIALAGFRLIQGGQVQLSCGPTADNPYTVVHANCRRVVALHLAAGDGDIRFEYGAAADATKLPILPRRYFIVDAGVGHVLHFYNTSGVSVNVFLAETE